MLNPKLRLPRFVVPWLLVIGLLFYLGKYVIPTYQHILDALGFLGFGPLLSFLAITVRSDVVQVLNSGQPPFFQIPKPGKVARPLMFVLGICLFTLGVVKALGYMQ